MLTTHKVQNSLFVTIGGEGLGMIEVNRFIRGALNNRSPGLTAE